MVENTLLTLYFESLVSLNENHKTLFTTFGCFFLRDVLNHNQIICLQNTKQVKGYTVQVKGIKSVIYNLTSKLQLTAKNNLARKLFMAIKPSLHHWNYLK